MSPEARIPDDRWKSKAGWLTLGGVATAAILIAFFIARIPDYIRGRIGSELARMGIEKATYEISPLTFSRFEITRIDLEDEGWRMTADSLTVSYNFFQLIFGHADVLEVKNFLMTVDLDAYQKAAEEEAARLAAARAASSAEDIAGSHQPAAKAITVPLRNIAKTLPLNLIKTNGAVFDLKRKDQLMHLVLDGSLALEGDAAVTIRGTGVTPASVDLSGKVHAGAGKADLTGKLEIENSTAALEHLFAGWSRDLGKTVVLDMGKLQVAGQFPVEKDELKIRTVDGSLDLKGYRQDEFSITASTLTLKKEAADKMVQFTSTPFEMKYGTGILDGAGLLSAQVDPALALNETLVQGSLNLEKLTVLAMPFNKVEVPFQGNLSQIKIGNSSVSSPDQGGGIFLANLDVTFEGTEPGKSRVSGQGNLGLRLPDLKVREEGESALKGAAALPIFAKVDLEKDSSAFEAILGIENKLAEPIIFDGPNYNVEMFGKLSAGGKSVKGKAEGNGQFRVDHLNLIKGESTVASLTELALEGLLQDDKLTIAGQGKLDGQVVPIQMTQTSHPELNPPTADGSYRAGPLAFTDVIWPGLIFPPLKDVKLSAQTELTGVLKDNGPGKPDGNRGLLTIRNGKMVYPKNALTISGVNADLTLTGFELPARMKVTAAVAEADPMKARNISVEFGPAKEGGFNIYALRADLLGGSMQLAGTVRIPPGEKMNFTMPLNFSSIDAQEVVNLIPNFDGKIQASVSGRLPVKVTNGLATFSTGFLKLDPGQPANLKYNATGLLTKDVRKGTLQYRQLEKAEKALGDMTITKLDLNLTDQTQTDIPITGRVEGVPVDPRLDIPGVGVNLTVDDQERVLNTFLAIFQHVLEVEIK